MVHALLYGRRLLPSPPPPVLARQACFLECLGDGRCENVFVEYVEITWMETPPPVACTLLGALADPAKGCQQGTGTLVKKLGAGRPQP